MSPPVESPSRVFFGLYEVNLHTGELWKAGTRIKIQGQPFKVLTALLERPGEVVSRDELQMRLWGKDTVVDFDHSLGTAINKIREALSDSADNPRFVETLARRGYRFIAPVSQSISRSSLPEYTANDGAAGTGATSWAPSREAEGRRESPSLEAPDLEAALPSALRANTPVAIGAAESHIEILHRATQGRLLLAAVLTAAVALLTFLAYQLGRARLEHPPSRISQLTQTGRIFPGQPSMENLPASATDGVHIFASVLENGSAVLAQIPVSSGDIQPLSLPSEIAAPSLGDLSPDGSSLLLRSHLSRESEQALWLVPASGGSARRIGNVLAHDATWMPGGDTILFAAGDDLFTIAPNAASPTRFASLPGRAFWLRWSPDGQLLRFTLIDPITHTTSLWELADRGHAPRLVLGELTHPALQCCGSWTADGKYFVFQSDEDGSSDLWRLNGKQTSGPVRLTSGPLSYQAPVTARSGHRIFFLGLDTHAHLQRFDATRKEFVPERGFLANVSRIVYSRDGRQMAWSDTSGRLWCSRTDGSERIQLTSDSIEVFLTQWSPDGTELAFMGREPGKSWQIYLIKSEGGTPDRILHENRNEADPSWSPDGNFIVFGRIPDVMGKESSSRTIQILDLKSHNLKVLPSSDGLFSPRWSPDGRYIAALSLDQRRLVLFDTTTGLWKLLNDSGVADPVWSADSKAIYFHAFMTETQPIVRLTIADGRTSVIASLANFPAGDAADYFFCGMAPDNTPLLRARTSTADFYSLDLDGK